MAGTTASAVFGYNPSMPMAWIGGVVFTLSALVHIFQYFKHRAWYLYLMMLGIFMEVFGYWTRVIAIQNPNNNGAVFMTFLLTTYDSFLFLKQTCTDIIQKACSIVSCCRLLYEFWSYYLLGHPRKSSRLPTSLGTRAIHNCNIHFLRYVVLYDTVHRHFLLDWQVEQPRSNHRSAKSSYQDNF